MAARRSSSLALSGEVSLSFRDELAATIHGAFEVAVEMAVLEISRLVSQALGDVREQMQETLRENTALKSRLQSLELRRGPAEEERLQTETGGGFTQQQQPELRTSSEGLSDESVSEQVDESFREIREDGRVRSQEWSPASQALPEHLDTGTQSSGPQHDSLESETPQKAELSPSLEDNENHSPVPLKEEPLHVKEESLHQELDDSSGDDTDMGSGCSFNPGSDEEFGPDKLSLVQSKLLEDWRPDPEQPQSEKSVDPAPSQGLDASHIIPSSSSVNGHPAFSASFDGLFPSVDRAHLGQPAPENYSVHVRTNAHPSLHLCKLCGHSFSRASDLRRHHSQQHKSRASNAGRSSSSGRPLKKQLFPPGCSPYHCNECGRDFNRMENLKTHLRIHTGERPYSCSVCGVRFRHSGALTRHFRIHTGEKPYVCGMCGKRFRNCGGLRFHQKSHSRDRHIFLK